METYCLKELYNEIKVIYVKRYTYISTIIQFLSSFSVQLYITIYKYNISNFESFLNFCCEIDEIILIRKTKQFHHDIRIASDVE